jgi:pimeloyl-ACP methyl ester carboxylesterase
VNATLDSWISGGSRRRITGSPHELFVRQDGPVDGKPVTLFHGFPASSFDWAGVVPALAVAGYRVTTLDFLGYGSSDKPHPYRYSLMEQATLVQAIWGDLGIDRTGLVAHDYGVSVAQELLSRDAGRVESMAWLNGGMFPDLHRPADFQRHLAELSGEDAEEFITETVYRKALLASWADRSARIRSARCGSISVGRAEHGWLPRCLAIWLNAASMPPVGRMRSKPIWVHRLSSGAPVIRLVDPMSYLVFETRFRWPASLCWTTRRR